jgi:hypothetical protein
VVLQLLHSYLPGFAAIAATLIQLAFLQILIDYRHWHLQVYSMVEQANLWDKQAHPENHPE